MRLFLGFAALMAIAPFAGAIDPVTSITHSGFLLDGADQPVTRTVGLRLRLFSALQGGAALWEGSINGAACPTPVHAGHYAVTLGVGCGAPIPVSIAARTGGVYLEVEVDGATLAPRHHVALVPGAVRALTSDDAAQLRAELSTPGVLNDAANPVQWTRLTGVPATLADGDDDTRYAAAVGGGLTLGAGNAFSVATQGVLAGMIGSGATAPGKVLVSDGAGGATWSTQGLATATACPTGQALRAFNADGSFTCGPAGPAAFNCPSGQVVSGLLGDGTPVCKDVFAGLPDADNDGSPDALDSDDDNDLVPDPEDAAPTNAALPGTPTARDGTSADKDMAYAPVTAGQGSLTVSWEARSAAAKYRVSFGTSAGASDVFGPVDVTGSTTYTAAGLSLRGAWATPATSYFAKVEYLNGVGVAVYAVVTDGVRIAEAVSWDGVSTAALRNDSTAGYSADFPSGSGLAVWGTHYFETVNIAAGTTVRVQGFGRADAVPANVSASDARVTMPRDGWVGIVADTIAVAGTITASGRGYGGGGGGGGSYSGGTGAGGAGGAGGLGGSGGSGGTAAGGGGSPLGAGGSGSQGGGSASASAAGGGAGRSEGGASAGQGNAGGSAGATGTVGARGASEAADGVSNGGAGENTAGGGAGGYSSPGSRKGGGGGGGYGAGGGGAAYNTTGGHTGGGGGGAGGGDGQSGSYGGSSGSYLAGGNGGTGAGPYGGAGGTCSASFSLASNGGYRSGAGNGDSTTGDEVYLGSGGAGGGGCNSATGAGGGGGAGGGSIQLVGLQSLRIESTAAVLANGAGGGGGGNSHDGFAGLAQGGGNGAGGGILLKAPAVTVAGSATVRALGAGNHGQSGGSASNGGTIKIRTVVGGLTGDVAASSAGRVLKNTY